MILRNIQAACSFSTAAALHRLVFHALCFCLLATSYTHAQSTFQPNSVWGMSSVFLEGKSMYIHGGTPTATSPPVPQTFSLDLSSNWTTSQPTFKKLADGFSDYKFPSTLMNDNENWLLVSNTSAWQYTFANDTWIIVGTNGNSNPAQGLGAVTDPSTGIVFIVNGFIGNGAISTLRYQHVGLIVDSVPTDPALVTVFNFAIAWSTVRHSAIIHGGATTTNTFQTRLYELLPSTGWSLASDTGDVPSPRKNHCMVPAYNGAKMILFGGIDPTGAVLGDIYFLDVATLVWTKGTDGGATVARGNTVCAVTNDLFVSWGGSDSKSTALTSNITVIYNMKTNAWQTTYSPLPDPSAPTNAASTPSRGPSTPTNGPATPFEPSPTASSSSSSAVPAIAGGVVGGIAAAACVAGFLLYQHKTRKHRGTALTKSSSRESESKVKLKADGYVQQFDGTSIPDEIHSGYAYRMSNIPPAPAYTTIQIQVGNSGTMEGNLVSREIISSQARSPHAIVQ